MKSMIAMVLLAGTATCNAGIVYVSGNGGVEPWGTGTIVNSMNTAFGNGNWTRMNFSDGASVLSGTDCLFIDGGDGIDNEFFGWLSGNQAALENWVAAGGSLFMNAAVWDMNPFSVGFGGMTSNYSYDGSASAVNGAHPIFNGPNGSTPLNFTGTAFSHNYFTGPGFSSVMVNGNGDSILIERTWGAGFVMLGGLTSPNFQSLGGDILRANINDYVCDQHLHVVPLPTGVGMAGLGLGLLAARRRR